MAKKKGSLKYVPGDVLGEIERIKHEDNLFSDADAFRRMAGINYGESDFDLDYGPLGIRKKKRRD